MSTIYIQEPPTNGKVLLETTVGDIDIELWAREAPKACRNFVQLCMEGYYDDTLFHRVVKGFIVQGGDPTGTGTGGESIYGHTFKDEIHTRLRFVRRGLAAMANAGKDDNGSQFFFTMAPCPELQNKHTVFGKVAGDTLYNMLKLEDGLVDHNDRPLYPHKILSTKVLLNPFTDIVPRILPKKDLVKETDSKSKAKGTKNFHLLSFGDEAEEDEEETNIVAKEYRGKSKSSHDLANDPNLSSLPAVETKDDQQLNIEDESVSMGKKLKKDEKVRKKHEISQEQEEEEEDESESKQKSKRKKIEEIKKEFKQLKKELVSSKQKGSENQTTEEAETLPKNEAMAEYYESTKKYVETKKSMKANKDTSHEDETIALLAKFQEKLESASASRKDDNGEIIVEDKKKKVMEEGEDDEDDDEGWWTHTLKCENQERLAKDANIANEDTFEIYDPRNPINQRRREASKAAMKDKKRK